MNNYTEPPTADLPRLCAEAMGWKLKGNVEYDWWVYNGKPIGVDLLCWHPEMHHDHSQLLIADAFAKGFGNSLICFLLKMNGPYLNQANDEKFLLMATPEQKTRAYLRAYHESKQ